MKMGSGWVRDRKGVKSSCSGVYDWLRPCSSSELSSLLFDKIIVGTVSKVGKWDGVVLAVTSQLVASTITIGGK